eukprot:5688514-Prymnesium_polylepis.1
MQMGHVDGARGKGTSARTSWEGAAASHKGYKRKGGGASASTRRQHQAHCSRGTRLAQSTTVTQQRVAHTWHHNWHPTTGTPKQDAFGLWQGLWCSVARAVARAGGVVWQGLRWAVARAVARAVEWCGQGRAHIIRSPPTLAATPPC